MPRKQHIIRLTPDERRQLAAIHRRGTSTALAFRRAHILLLADTAAPGRCRSDAQVAEAAGVSARTVARTRDAWCRRGLASLRRPGRANPRKLTPAGEARLVALACSTPPDGHAAWSLRLLADRAVELRIAGSLSHETVRRTLKKTMSSRG
jgi:transposase